VIALEGILGKRTTRGSTAVNRVENITQIVAVHARGRVERETWRIVMGFVMGLPEWINVVIARVEIQGNKLTMVCFFVMGYYIL